MNFPNLLLVFTSLLGRNDEKNGTNLMPKIQIHENTEKNEIYPIAYESSLHHQITTLPSKEISHIRGDSCQEVFTNGNFTSEDFRTRNCMCDENCPIYKDCCKDSIHHNKSSDSQAQFSCVSTPLNGDIYMVTKCLPGYSDLETIFKCETLINSAGAVHDISLILPVTNSERNITYANSFCAVCNKETRFETWDPVLYYELGKIHDQEISNQSSSLVEKIYSTIINRDTILSHLVAGNGTNLISQFNDLTYKCRLFANMPEEMTSMVRYCRLNDKKGRESREKFFDENLIPLDRHNLPANLFNPKMEFDFSQKFRTKINNHMRTCIYSVTQTGDPCLVNTLFSKDTDLDFMGNGQVFVKKYNFTFDETEYTNETSIKNTIYVCGTEIPDKNETVTAVKVFLSRSSSFFIILLLIMNADKKKLQNLSDKMTYAYCITMLLVYGAFEMHRHPRWCLFTQESMHYFFLSHFFWFLAMSYELWNVICRLSVKFQSMSGKSHMKRFIVYCLLCWIIPLPVIPITMYYRKFVNIPTNCPMILGYQIRRPCLTIPESPISLYVFFINSVIICINLSLFAHVCYHIYLTKRSNVKSTSHNNYFELFAKLALTMDLQWFFYLFSFSDIEALKVINTMLTSSHGLITFLAYGVKKSIFISFYEKCKSYFDVVQKVRNFFSVLFGGVKRPPFLKRHSVEPSTHHTGVDLLSNV